MHRSVRTKRLLPVVVAVAGLSSAAVRAERFDGSFAETDPDVVVRFFHEASQLRTGEVMVTGGMRLQLIPLSLISLAEVSFLDPTDGSVTSTFQPLGGGDPVSPRLGVPRSSHTQTTLVDGRVLVTGGRTGAEGTSSGTPVASVELFDPVTGAVTTGPAMSGARAAHTATRLRDGRVVVAGGGGTWQVFTAGAGPRGGAWSSAFPLQRSRADHAAVLLPGGDGADHDRVLLVGGSGSGPATLEILDPDLGTSDLASAALFIGVDDLAAVRLDDGAVLIVGGQDLSTGDTVDLTYRYDPVGDVLTQVPSPPERVDGIADHALVVLGRFALAFGGEQQVAGVDCELDYAAAFDRAADDWVFVSSMTVVHDDFAAVPLDDGRVALIDGGAPLFGQAFPTNAIELFTPSTARPADLDGDGVVGFSDIIAILAAWGPCPGEGGCGADLDFSGLVDFGDVLIVLTRWGPCV